jgi:hypothetical protein
MVKLEDFINWWRQDGLHLVKQREVEKGGHRWIMFTVYSEESRVEYGRHFVLLVVVSKDTEEIVAHDMANQLNYDPMFGMDSWFERHVQEGLVNVS